MPGIAHSEVPTSHTEAPHGGTMTVSGCTLTVNSAFGPDLNMGEGGAIYNNGYCSLIGSLVASNTAGGMGAAIFNDRLGNLSISKNSVTNNFLGFMDGGTEEVDLYNAGKFKISGGSTVGVIYNG